MRRILLDTDMGTDADDALCLALALAAPDVELVAVTTVTADTVRRARIARRLLDLAGRHDTPVYAGCREPRSAAGSFLWLGYEGDFCLAPDDATPVEAEPAPEAIARLSRAHDGLEVVAVGPLTNLAAALDLDPSLVGRIERLTVMGGHVREVAHQRHVFPPGVDYNLCSDAASSLRVLSAGIPTRLVTADVTLATWLGPEDVARVEAAGTPFHRAIAAAVRDWTPRMRQIFAGMGATLAPDNAAFLHDPLALACAYDESFCRFEDLAIEPCVVDGVFRTLERPPGSAGAFAMRCATAVDAQRVREHVVERLVAGPRRR